MLSAACDPGLQTGNPTGNGSGDNASLGYGRLWRTVRKAAPGFRGPFLFVRDRLSWQLGAVFRRLFGPAGRAPRASWSRHPRRSRVNRQETRFPVGRHTRRSRRTSTPQLLAGRWRRCLQFRPSFRCLILVFPPDSQSGSEYSVRLYAATVPITRFGQPNHVGLVKKRARTSRNRCCRR